MKEQQIKLRIRFAKLPKVYLVADNKYKVTGNLEDYKTVNKFSNIYLILEDRTFHSPTLARLYRLFEKDVKDSLTKYILEGMTVTENAIQSIELKIQDSSYFISDIFEVIEIEV